MADEKNDQDTKQDEDKVGGFDAAVEINRVRQSVWDTPAPGTDPDSIRRAEKHAAASNTVIGVDTVDGPDTDDDADDKDTKADAAKARKAASPTRTTAPQGRSSTPVQKAAE